MSRRRTLLFPLLVAALLGSAAIAPTASAAERVKVMTRNLYLGADLTPLVASSSREQFAQRATQTFQAVQATDFSARAERLAREVRAHDPDLIGLQEVALYRRGADGVVDGPATPATTVLIDFLKTFRTALRRKGLDYRVASRQTEADLETPTDQNFDLRLTMRDVILVRTDRRGLSVRGARGANFGARLTLPTAIGPISFVRGWTSVLGRIRGERFRFLNTHLEAFSSNARNAQAQELVAAGGPAVGSRRTVLVGDLNSDPENAAGTDSGAADILKAAGFRDAWATLYPGRPGPTCCHAATLLNATVPFDRRIDHVMSRGRGLRALSSVVVGDEPANRTTSGLWPSDHGGVVTRLRLR